MPSSLSMPMPMSQSAPKWDGEAYSLRDFIRRLEQLFKATETTSDGDKLRWATSYVDAEIYDIWTSFEEYYKEDATWQGFVERLKIEYPELTEEEQGSMEQLKKICQQFRGLTMQDGRELLNFKRKFLYMAQKCLQAPAVTGNRELVELFLRTLDESFRQALDNRLKIQGKIRVVQDGRLRTEDPYELSDVIEMAVQLANGHSVSKAYSFDGPSGSGVTTKVDVNSRAPVRFTKQEANQPPANLGLPDVEQLHEEINNLKTMTQETERQRERHERSIQSAIDSLRAMIQSKGTSQPFEVAKSFY